MAGKPGDTVSFRVAAQGGKLSYLWYSNAGHSSSFDPVPGGVGRRLDVKVTPASYGVYYCSVGNEDDWDGVSVVQTRWATLGEIDSSTPGGNFVPVQNSITAGTVQSICGNPVSGHWVRFPGSETSPATGFSKFQGALFTVQANGNLVPINNTDYILQMFVTVANTSCCTPIAGNMVQGSIAPSTVYRYIAHFKVGAAPPDGTAIQLQGAWVP